MKSILIVCMAVLLSVPAGAAPIYDTFHVLFDESGEYVVGGGSGYDGDGDGDGDWYFYPNTNWWNEWFYNAELDTNRWKKIDVSVTVIPTMLHGSWADILVNWSSELYTGGTGEPPLPEDMDPSEESDWIVRDEWIFDGDVLSPMVFEKTIIIPDYNPEWISIDIRGAGIQAYGLIVHECIPEPATLVLFGIGGFMALVWKRRSA